MKSPSGKERPFDSWDAIKLIALLLMFVDHSGHFFFEDDKWLRAIGRGAAPIFMFLAGFAASYRFKWDLFALAVLMSVSDFLLTGHLRTQNILFTILGCRMIFALLERRGRKIERPWEWYIGTISMMVSIFVVQYGSLGMLFAISGYLKRRSQQYPPALPRQFLIASFVSYGLFEAYFSGFSVFDLALMLLTLYGVYILLLRLSIHQLRPSGVAPWLLSTGKWISFYSGYIYAFHAIALEWLTGHPF